MRRALETAALPLAAIAALGLLTLVYFRDVLAPQAGMSIGGDVAALTYPYRRAVTDAVRAGRLPNWSPYIGFGHPLLADPEATALYPVSLAASLLFQEGLSYRSVHGELILHYFVVAVGMLFLLRRLGLDWFAGTLGAAVFPFAGFMWAHLGHVTIIQSVSWAPWALLGAVHLIERPTVSAAIATGVALALAVLGGHPQAAYHVALTVLIVLAVGGARAMARGEVSPAAFARAGLLVAAVALGLAAIQVLPTAVLAQQSRRWSPEAGYLLSYGLHAGYPLTFLVPLAFRGTPHAGSLGESHGYVGIAPLVLAAWALWRVRSRWVLALATLGALGALAAMAIPPFVHLLSAGVFRIPSRAVLLVDLAIVGLAAFGAQEAWSRRGTLARAERWGLGALWGAAALVVGGAGWLHLAGLPDALLGHVHPRFPEQWLGFAARLVAAVLALNLARCAGLGQVPGRALLLGVVLVEVLTFPRELAFARVPAGAHATPPWRLSVVAPELGPYRAAILGRTSHRAANAGLVHRVPLAALYSSLPHHRLGPVLERVNNARGIDILRVAAVRVLLTSADPHARLARMQDTPLPEGLLPPPQRFEARAPGIWLVPDPLPRAYLSRETRVIRDPGRLLQALEALDPREAVLVERSRATCPTPAGDGAAAPGEVRVVTDEPERIVLRVQAPGPRPLVLSDTHYPGWQATVDGSPVPVHRANYLFRMVCVPAGAHTVEFRFRQPGLLPGALLAGATAAGAVALLVAERRRRGAGTRTGGPAPGARFTPPSPPRAAVPGERR